MPSTTHRLTAPDRRRQLIEAAMDLFSRKGFAGTTTKEIALAAGVSEAIIFRHFATKRDLYTANFVFVFQSRVPNELIPMNPLGLTISYFREDQAFK